MPYVFPNETWFALGVGLLILGLLVVRIRLARRRRFHGMARVSDEPSRSVSEEPGSSN